MTSCHGVVRPVPGGRPQGDELDPGQQAAQHGDPGHQVDVDLPDDERQPLAGLGQEGAEPRLTHGEAQPREE